MGAATATVRIRQILIPALLALGAALLYLPQLRDAPIYLGRDEMFFGLTAHSLASTGRDTTGRFMPLYFQSQMRYGSEMWFQPILMYAITFSVKVWGLSEGTIRLPMALAGIIDVVLVYFIGRLLFDRELPAIAASVLLALTPAHFIHSRVAMDFQTPLPFILGWLLCLLMYLRRGSLSLLFTAGLLLGIGLYSYIAAYMLMPIYALLTCVVLYQRREPLKRYGPLAAGFILPVLVSLPFLLRHPTVLHDIFWHYERDKPQSAGAFDLLAAFFTYDRFAGAASLYGRFWNPRFLFINGPQSMWVAGAFLLPAAGLLVVGVLRALRRPAPYAVLLIGGLLSAPIPASLVGDGEAIHRAAAVVPFGVLLGIVGLDYLWTAESWRARGIAFVTTWGILIGLAAAYHDDLPLAQAMVRASTVPLAIAGLCLLFNKSVPDRIRVGAVAAIAGLFVYVYGDSSNIHRVGRIPASAILLAVRVVYASCAVAAAAGLAALLERVDLNRLEGRHWLGVAAVTIVAIQITYFYIDYFVRSPARVLQAIVLFAAAVAGAAWLARNAARVRFTLAHLTAAALLGLVSLQFANFYVDYFTRYRVRSGNLDPEGNARVAWETLIERARHRSVPVIYLGNVGPYGFGDLYWTFYAIKHNREDLLTQTISDVAFEPDRVRNLPDASLVVTSPSPQTDATVERMLTSGELREKTLVTAPDGTSTFWILETSARTNVAVP